MRAMLDGVMRGSRSDYQSLEGRIVASIGKAYGPYTERCFANTGETDIEHIVATSEAHHRIGGSPRVAGGDETTDGRSGE